MSVLMKTLKSAALLAAVAGMVAATTLPASAQLVRRNSNGNLLIDPLLCQTDYQVRQAVASAGYRNIFLNAPIETHIRVRATRGNTVYLIDYNRCFGGIVSATPLRSAK